MNRLKVSDRQLISMALERVQWLELVNTRETSWRKNKTQSKNLAYKLLK